jgi:NAD(P)-dependent dehydrogenase (short-subunit alcohol dehydrogenase family)
MSNSIIDLTEKVVVITGGTGIQGPEHKKAFEKTGAIVVVTDINGGDFKMDATDEDNIREVIEKVINKYGKIDVWVNNHGATGKQAVTDWNHIIKVNLTGTYQCCKLVAEQMTKTGGGSIINLASIYGLVAPDFNLYPKAEYDGKPMGVPAAYSASKGGVISLTKHLASLWADKGIRVNCVSPGGIYDKQSDNFVKQYAKKTMLNRMANKNEISGALLYLASDLSSYVTGDNVVVDGGLTARA